MLVKFPSYTKIFEETNRRLKTLEKLGTKKTGELEDTDKFLFLIVGNLNLRLNTIFFLLENNITDGVLPLQRTVFELQIAFKVYSESDEKERFLKSYFNKKGFENSVKWERVLNSNNADLFTDEDREILSDFKNEYKLSIKESFAKSPFKIWYELASDKSLKELSDEFYTGAEYFANYDELSNWVHPQRLEENIDVRGFTQNLPLHYYNLLIGSLMWAIDNLTNDIAYIVKSYNISKSSRLFKYGENISMFLKELKNMLIDDTKKDHN